MLNYTYGTQPPSIYPSVGKSDSEGEGLRVWQDACMRCCFLMSTLSSPSAGDTATFAEVIEAARRLQQTAMGYVLRDGSITMVPEASSCHRFMEGDQIIVLAQDYNTRRK